jgi:hypothetical protein
MSRGEHTYEVEDGMCNKMKMVLTEECLHVVVEKECVHEVHVVESMPKEIEEYIASK